MITPTLESELKNPMTLVRFDAKAASAKQFLKNDMTLIFIRASHVTLVKMKQICENKLL